MTKAQRLRALIPAIHGIYNRAQTRVSEHGVVVLLNAFGLDPWEFGLNWRCRDCDHMTAAQFAAMVDGGVL